MDDDAEAEEAQPAAAAEGLGKSEAPVGPSAAAADAQPSKPAPVSGVAGITAAIGKAKEAIEQASSALRADHS